MLPIYIRVRSEYFEHDSSRYRLGITQNTLCKSLIHQTDKNFFVLLKQSPMDPFFTKRLESFRNVVNDEPDFPHIEIEVGDDDFLCPTFIDTIRKIPSQKENCFLSFPNGYIFLNGKMTVFRQRDNFVTVTSWVNPGEHVGKTIDASVDASWIYVRHNMNSFVIPDKFTEGNRVNGLKWAGWKELIVAKYCNIELKTATSNGSTLHPRKSKSVVIGKGTGGARRR